MRVSSIKKIEPRLVFAIETSTHTFIADGIAHHNCSGCNMNGGEQFLYGLFMKRKYNMTDEQLEAMRVEARKTRQYKLHDYIRIAEEYQSKGDELVKSKGL